MLKLEQMKREDLKIFDEQELWDQGKDIEEFYLDLDLEEELLGHIYESAKDIQYKVGDIIMASNFIKSEDSKDVLITDPHRILIITSTTNHNYTGFIMSSKVNKASVYKDGFNNSILVDNVADIITVGQKPKMPCIIKVDTLVNITDDNLEDYGVFKGHVSNEFLNFIIEANKLYHAGEDMSKICWQDGSGKLIVEEDN